MCASLRPWARAALGIAMLGTIALGLSSAAISADLGTTAIERWTAAFRSGNAQRLEVSDASYFSPAHLADAALPEGQAVELTSWIPATAWTIDGILRDSGLRIDVGHGGRSYDLALRWNSGQNGGTLELRFEDPMGRILGHWRGAAGEAQLRVFGGGAFRILLSTPGRLGAGAYLGATATAAPDPQPATTGEPLPQVSTIPRVDLKMSPANFATWDTLREATLATVSVLGAPGAFSNQRVPSELVVEGQTSFVEVSQAGVGLIVHVSKETPSFTVQVRQGPLFFSMSRFKLFSIRAVGGLLDYAVNSVMRDEGVLAPRMALVNVFFNDQDLGLYVAEEMPKSQGFFEALRRHDGQITAAGRLFVDSTGDWARKEPVSRGSEFSPEFAATVNRVQFAKTLALVSRFHATHGLNYGGDFRLYRSVLLEQPEPWVRDINVDMWSESDVGPRSLLVHARSWLGLPWFEGGAINNPKLFPAVAGIPTGTEDYSVGPASLGLANIHPAALRFLQVPENRELFDQYLLYLSDPVYHRRFAQRLNSVFQVALPLLASSSRDRALPDYLWDVTEGASNDEAWIRRQVGTYSGQEFLVAQTVPLFAKHSALLVDAPPPAGQQGGNQRVTLYNLSPFSTRLVLPGYVRVPAESMGVGPANDRRAYLAPSQAFLSVVPIYGGSLDDSPDGWSIDGLEQEASVPLSRPAARRLLALERARFAPEGEETETPRPWVDVEVPAERYAEFLAMVRQTPVSYLAGALPLSAQRTFELAGLPEAIENTQRPAGRGLPARLGPKAHWDFDQADLGSDAFRLPAPLPVPLPDFRGPVRFDGRTSFVDSGLDLSQMRGFAFAFWLKLEPRQPEELSVILDLNHDAERNCVLQLSPAPAGDQRSLTWYCGGTGVSQEVAVDRWLFITVSANRDTRQLHMSVDGGHVNTATSASEPFGAGALLMVGRWKARPERFLAGTIEALRFWDRALQPEEISEFGRRLSLQDAPQPMPGVRGSALWFNGRTSALESSLDFSILRGFSFALWLMLDQVQQQDLSVVLDLNHGAQRNCELQHSPAPARGQRSLTWDCGGTSLSQQVPLGRWLFVTVGANRDSQEIYMSVNGGPVGTAMSPGEPYGDGASLVLGRWKTGPGGFLAGTIDEMRFWDRALTAEELSEVASSLILQDAPAGSQPKAGFLLPAPRAVVFPLGLESKEPGSRLRVLISNVSEDPVSVDVGAIKWRDAAGVEVPATITGVWELGERAPVPGQGRLLLGAADPGAKATFGRLPSPWLWPGGFSGLLQGPATPSRPNSILFEVELAGSGLTWTDASSLAIAERGVPPPLVVVLEPFGFFRHGMTIGTPAGLAPEPAQVTVSDANTGDEDSAALVDEDPATYWHIKWPPASAEHWVALDAGKPVTLQGISFLPRFPGGEQFWEGDRAVLQATNETRKNVRWVDIARLQVDKNDLDPFRQHWVTFAIDNETAYRRYRIVISDPGFLSLAEMRVQLGDSRPQDRTVEPVEALIRNGTFVVENSEGARILRPARKELVLSKPLLIPEGYVVEFGPGALVRAAEGAGILSFSPIRALGTRENPIAFLPVTQQSGWKGIAVAGARGDSEFRHVRMEGAAGGFMGPHQISGGLSFYNTSVRLVETHLLDFSSVDGLHISHSSFEISGLTIERTANDALDIDWSYGSISDAVLKKCGGPVTGDCLDLSGSFVTVAGITVSDAFDKGISIGEQSVVRLSGAKVTASKSGLAVKDGSVAVVDQCRITENHYGILEYIKKPQYAFPSLSLADCKSTGNVVDTRSESPSQWTNQYN